MCLLCFAGINWALNAGAVLDSVAVDGGTVAGNGVDTLYFNPEAPEEGQTVFTNSAGNQPPGARYAYVITTATEEPVILSVIPRDTFNFGPITIDEVRVYGINYTGSPLFRAGYPVEDLPLSDSCFALSQNFVTVFKRAQPVSSVDVGNKQLARVTLVAAPNPVRGGALRISLTKRGTLAPGRLTLRTLAGRLLAIFPVPPASSHTIVAQTNDLPPGMYVAIYASSAARAFTKFIVQ